jgi:hypothetical protein
MIQVYKEAFKARATSLRARRVAIHNDNKTKNSQSCQFQVKFVLPTQTVGNCCSGGTIINPVKQKKLFFRVGHLRAKPRIKASRYSLTTYTRTFFFSKLVKNSILAGLL